METLKSFFNINEDKTSSFSKTIINNVGTTYYPLTSPFLLTSQNLITPQQHQILKKSLTSVPCERIDNICKIIDPDRYALRTEKGYVWVPTEFLVNDKGTVEEISHVEHISRAKYPNVYSSLGCIFEAMIPALSEVMNLDSAKKDEKGRKKLSVIVKAQQFDMDPSSTYEGYWHTEGIPEEAIAAVGLYYYEVGNTLKGCALRLRPKKVTYYFSEPVYSPDNDAVIPIQEGTAIVFSNETLVHKCSLVENTSQYDKAKRSYVGFFVVNPNPVNSIKSSTPYPNITTKNLGCRNKETSALVLDRIFGHGVLPIFILELICEMAGWGCVTLEEQTEALETIKMERLEVKNMVESSSGENSQLGFTEGWSAMDGGVMGFRNY